MDLTKFISEGDELVAHPAGDVLFRAGDAASTMLVVMEGTVEILRDGSLVRTVAAGGIIGEMALVDNQPRSADAVAATDVRVAHIDERRFLFLVQDTPSFALSIMSVMADRLRDLSGDHG